VVVRPGLPLALVHRSADGASLTISSHRAAASARFIEATAIEDLFGVADSEFRSDQISGSVPPDMPLRVRRNRPEWQQVTISVASHPVTFRMLASGSDWVAVAEFGDIYIKLHASRRLGRRPSAVIVSCAYCQHNLLASVALQRQTVGQ
jgi:hypothetical protein